ncbi:MAG: ABC transporter substrate-binding protein [Oscillospiraceae bacterium]|nr:ABC transporter substrate-binding protein [Oscillospiraceae bacterium]
MKKRMRIIALALAIIMVMGLIAACANDDPAPAGTDDPTEATQQDDIIRPDDDGGVVLDELDEDAIEGTRLAEEVHIIVDNNNIVVLNPHNPGANATSTNWVLTMIHDRLFDQIPGEGFVPSLALSYETEDYQHFIFNLRQGVTFHNGDPFTAEDVVWTIRHAQEHGLGSNAAGNWSPVVSAEVLDDYTLEIVLDGIDVDFIFAITRPPSGILSQRAIAEDPETGFWIGTGAFSVEEFVSNDFALLRRNMNYWGTIPVTELVRLRFVPDMATRTIMMNTGAAHLSFGTPTEDMADFQANPDFMILTTTSNDPQGLQFNLNDPITGCYYFRRAVVHTLNREAIAFGSAGDWADGNLTDGAYWGIGTEFRNRDIPLPERNLDLAREYLERSVYNGEEVGLVVAIATFIRSAGIIQMQLEEIGINVRIDETDPPGLSASAVYGGDHQMVVFFTLINPSAGSARQAFIPGGTQNRATFNNPRVTELLDEARRTGDVAAREAMYMEVQEIVAEYQAFTNLFWRVFGNVAVNGLGGIRLNPDPSAHDFRNIYVDLDA